MLATVDTHALGQLIWVAPLAVLTVTVAWNLVVNGVARAADARRDGRTIATGAYGALAIAGFAVFAAAIVYGLIIMTTK